MEKDDLERINKMLRRLFEPTKPPEQKVDADGVPFTHIEGDFKGQKVEINISEYGVHARKAGDNRTTRSNMDQSGLINWFKEMFR